jgi:hypothetical protein
MKRENSFQYVFTQNEVNISKMSDVKFKNKIFS